MTKYVTQLSETVISNAEARSKPYKLFDGGGLYLNIMPSGARIWRFKFRQHDRKENQLTFGPYPKVSLQEARDRCREARQLLRQGVDLVEHRNEAKQIAAEIAANELRNSEAKSLVVQLEPEIFDLISSLLVTERKCRGIIDSLRTIKESLAPESPSAREP
ncbi:Arm DNA-binding domain-containing protein [Massilia sp.]|uniref:Arm DNA-binding domain-containing protein n=1 Tax=Massilia sp. TaxID=1882437 RepID=UPI00352C49B1